MSWDDRILLGITLTCLAVLAWLYVDPVYFLAVHELPY